MPDTYNYEYFNVTFPHEYVAQVEINRPEKLNAFIEKYVLCIVYAEHVKPLQEVFRTECCALSWRTVLRSASCSHDFTGCG